MFSFHVVTGSEARRIISRSRVDIIRQVRHTYLLHYEGRTVNPNSYFLRFPEKPNSRIIALPAYVGGEQGVAGIKWIASFPDNVSRNVPRASAALLLNDYETGYPFACLEASQISAARTAASAVLGAEALQGGTTARKIAVVGAGIIARNIVEFFQAAGWDTGQFAVHDTVLDYAAKLAGYIGELGMTASVETELAKAVDGADVVVFATTAAEPYVVEEAAFAPGQNVLNVSLRDIGPDVIASSHNILDDIDHCLTANTSPHLAQQKFGHHDFVDGTLAGVLTGEVRLGRDKPRIFSPFGLGVLDLAVGMHVYTSAKDGCTAVEIPDFFGETERWSR
ncbi:2,3-diaminopropionate biosynthesis protein SbnB [Streptomyces sp. Ac-502]|uniref:2,3-diaminopropionate biosynthesis protein SbnB n=1 Tax=Streptomyces sp. Ac-502 TaxID=3342801 RepID=UPI003862771C